MVDVEDPEDILARCIYTYIPLVFRENAKFRQGLLVEFQNTRDGGFFFFFFFSRVSLYKTTNEIEFADKENRFCRGSMRISVRSELTCMCVFL